MIIVFSRHGETSANTKDIFQGASDFQLTEIGIEQSRTLGKLFKGMKIKRIYSSPSQRAKKTALIAAKICGGDVIVDQRLREVCYGRWEGVEHRQLVNEKEWAKRSEDVFNFIHPGTYKSKKGESYKNQYFRLIDFLEQTKNDRHNIGVVAHLGIMRNAYMYFARLSEEEFGNFKPKNNEVLIFDTKHFKMSHLSV